MAPQTVSPASSKNHTGNSPSGEPSAGAPRHRPPLLAEDAVGRPVRPGPRRRPCPPRRGWPPGAGGRPRMATTGVMMLSEEKVGIGRQLAHHVDQRRGRGRPPRPPPAGPRRPRSRPPSSRPPGKATSPWWDRRRADAPVSTTRASPASSNSGDQHGGRTAAGIGEAVGRGPARRPAGVGRWRRPGPSGPGPGRCPGVGSAGEPGPGRRRAGRGPGRSGDDLRPAAGGRGGRRVIGGSRLPADQRSSAGPVHAGHRRRLRHDSNRPGPKARPVRTTAVAPRRRARLVRRSRAELHHAAHATHTAHAATHGRQQQRRRRPGRPSRACRPPGPRW